MPDDDRTDAMTAAAMELVNKIGPILHGHDTDVVVGVITALMGDVLCCYTAECRLEAASIMATRALRLTDKLQHVRPMPIEPKH